MKKYTKTHQILIVTGWFFIVISIVLSFFHSIKCITYNGLGFEHTYTTTMGFFSSLFLVLGAGEGFLLFTRKKNLRILSVLLTSTKLVSPWIVFSIYKVIEKLMESEFSTHYEISNCLPCVITCLTVVLLILQIVLLFAVPLEKDAPKEKTAENQNFVW